MKKIFNKYILASLLSLLTLLGCTKDPDIPSREDGMILIATAQSLAKIGVDANYPLNGYYVLAANIELSEYENWIPIGTSDAPFIGTFDGSNKSISKLTINATDTHQGLFGYISGATVKNLNIYESSVASSVSYASAITGYAINSTIKGCYVYGGSVCGLGYVGSIVGYAKGSSVVACYNTGEVYSTDRGITGGVVGYANESSITACYNVGAVNSNGYAGGVVGYSSSSTITACYFIDQLGDEAHYGIGANNDTSYTSAVSLVTLNNYVETMNSAAGESYFTAGSPSDTNLPYLMGENLLLEGDEGYDEDDVTVDSEGNIEISTATQLASIGINSNYPISGNYILTENIDLSDYSSWTPIGTDDSTAFTGTFEGNNKTISGLTINASSNFQGLFGYISNATIRNLNIYAPSIINSENYNGAIAGCATASTVENSSVEGGYVKGEECTGGIVGIAQSYSYIKFCHNSSVINGTMYIGGVCGESYYAYITACFNTATVSIDDSESTDYVGCAGGVVGYSVSTTIKSCYNTGAIRGTINSGGGIVGLTTSYTYITSCYNTGSVNGAKYSGGIIGYSFNDTRNTMSSCCYIDQDDDASSGIGGVPSSSYINNADAIPVTINDLNNYVDTMNDAAGATYFTAGSPSDTNLPYLMGENLIYEEEYAAVNINANGEIEISTAKQLSLIGYHSNYPCSGDYILMNNISLSEYSNWKAIGLVTVFTGTFNGNNKTISDLKSDSSGLFYSKGLFSSISGATISNLKILEPYIVGTSYSVGAIVGDATDSTIERCCVEGGYVRSSKSYVGGIVGYTKSTSIIACYSTVSVSGDEMIGGVVGWSISSSIIACYNTGAISVDDNYAGGVVGYSSSSTDIISCYSVGSVNGGNNTGGVVGGLYNSTISNSYYIDQTSDDATSGITYNSGGTGTASATTLIDLNSYVDTMNTATGLIYFTVGSPSDTNLPYLMGENLEYVGD